MKPLSRGERLYWNERSDIDDDSRVTSFSKLMGLQALYIGNMIQSRRNNHMDGVLRHWTKLGIYTRRAPLRGADTLTPIHSKLE